MKLFILSALRIRERDPVGRLAFAKWRSKPNEILPMAIGRGAVAIDSLGISVRRVPWFRWPTDDRAAPMSASGPVTIPKGRKVEGPLCGSRTEVGLQRARAIVQHTGQSKRIGSNSL